MTSINKVELVSMIERGIPHKVIAHKFGVTRGAVTMAVKRVGEKPSLAAAKAVASPEVYVDPASPEFERLPRVERARIYASLRWGIDDIMDELEVEYRTVQLYLTPGAYERYQEHKRAFAASPGAREKARASNARYRASEKGKAMRARSNERRRVKSS